MKYFTLFCCITLGVFASQGKKPNIVFILADDVSPDMYGFYGNKQAKTPNIDRIASEGVMFRTAWSWLFVVLHVRSS